MRKARRMVLSLTCMLFSAAGLADEANSFATHGEALPEAELSAPAAPEQWDYAPRWRLSHPVETMDYANDWSQPTVNVDFRDSGALARFSKLRSFSLLTFAEFGRTRLFLGVDDNGIVGLHLRPFHRVGDERYLEVVRMPYLEDDQPNNGTE